MTPDAVASVGSLPVTAADVEGAAHTIAGRIVRTPAAVSQTLSEILGATVAVKFENLQFTGSYKERGALARLLSLTAEERQRGVVAMSAGNFAQAVAYHAGIESIPATLVMPLGTPTVKASRTRALGADVLLEGRDLREAEGRARSIARERDLVFLSPYDDEAVIAGQGTVVLEMLDDLPDLDVLVVPVGGGGLLAGMAVAAAARRPDLEMVGVQVDTYASMVGALAGESIVCRGRTIAEGIAVERAGVLTRRIIASLGCDVVTVREESIEEAVCLFLEVEKVVAEGAAAATLAALLEHPARFRGKRVGVVLTGGNIDLRLLASVIMRGLVRSGRLATIRLEVPDQPGALGRVTAVVGAHGGNIVELSHCRTVLDIPSKAASVELLVETEAREQLTSIVEALRQAGYAPAVYTP